MVQKREPVLLSRGPGTLWHRKPKHTMRSTLVLWKFGKAQENVIQLHSSLAKPPPCLREMKVVLAELLPSLCQHWAAVLPHLGSPQGLPSSGGALHQLCTQAAPAPAPLLLHILLLASLNFRQEKKPFGKQIFHSIPQLHEQKCSVGL